MKRETRRRESRVSKKLDSHDPCPECGSTTCKACGAWLTSVPKQPITKWEFVTSYVSFPADILFFFISWLDIRPSLSWLSPATYTLMLNLALVITSLVLLYSIIKARLRPASLMRAKGRRVPSILVPSDKVFAIASLVIILCSVGLVSMPQGATELHIATPANGATVGTQEEVTGTSKNLPNGQTIWILLHPQNTNLYYPQDKTHVQNETTVLTNGNWNTTVYFGVSSKSDIGIKFDVVAGLANQDAEAALNYYQTKSAQEGSWNGTALPNGLTLYDKSTVTKT